MAEWLVKADNPSIVTAKLGRNPEAVEELVRLAELLAVPVTDRGRLDCLNFPTTHPLYNVGPATNEADVLLIMESPVPFTAPGKRPGLTQKLPGWTLTPSSRDTRPWSSEPTCGFR